MPNAQMLTTERFLVERQTRRSSCHVALLKDKPVGDEKPWYQVCRTEKVGRPSNAWSTRGGGGRFHLRRRSDDKIHGFHLHVHGRLGLCRHGALGFRVAIVPRLPGLRQPPAAHGHHAGQLPERPFNVRLLTGSLIHCALSDALPSRGRSIFRHGLFRTQGPCLPPCSEKGDRFKDGHGCGACGHCKANYSTVVVLSRGTQIDADSGDKCPPNNGHLGH
jgi:hypothetical protein